MSYAAIIMGAQDLSDLPRLDTALRLRECASFMEQAVKEAKNVDATPGHLRATAANIKRGFDGEPEPALRLDRARTAMFQFELKVPPAFAALMAVVMVDALTSTVSPETFADEWCHCALETGPFERDRVPDQ